MPQARHHGTARRQWRRQDDDAEGDLQPSEIRARRGDQEPIVYRGDRVQDLSPADLVSRGVIQVMEGRHCFELTVEENLMTGAYTRRSSSAEIRRDLDMVYTYFPRLKERRKSQAGYTSGGEQQMTAIGQALMSRPETILLDEPSMGLAWLVEQIFEIVKAVNDPCFRLRTLYILLFFLWEHFPREHLHRFSQSRISQSGSVGIVLTAAGANSRSTLDTL